MPGFLERLHTLWAALRLRLRGGAPGLFYIGGSDTMPAPLDRAAEQQAIRALAAGSEEAASLLIEHNLPITMKVCDRIMVLSYGKKIAEGPPEVVKHDKQVIEAYLGSDDS